jgi:hypothetical protein
MKVGVDRERFEASVKIEQEVASSFEERDFSSHSFLYRDEEKIVESWRLTQPETAKAITCGAKSNALRVSRYCTVLYCNHERPGRRNHTVREARTRAFPHPAFSIAILSSRYSILSAPTTLSKAIGNTSVR